MPFKSEAQRRKFHVMAARGEISEDVVREWEHATEDKQALPRHVKHSAYNHGALAALAYFEKGALETAPPPGTTPGTTLNINPNISPMAARTAGGIVGGGAEALLSAIYAPEGDKVRQGVIGAIAGATGAVMGPMGMVASPLINMGLQKLTAKQAEHADDRLKERSTVVLPPNTLADLRRQIKTLEVSPGKYYLPLKGPSGNTAAIAAFKTVGKNNELVLATVLKPKKTPPPGSSLSHVLRQPRGEEVGKIDATPKQYTLRKDATGALSCTCNDFKFRHRAAGTRCKHLEAHVNKVKIADENAERQDGQAGQDGHILRNSAMLAAAAAPWLGTIGQRPKREAPAYTEARQLLDLAEPGDVWLNADAPNKSFFKELRGTKTQVSLGTGTPEGYHAGMIDAPKGERILHFNSDTGFESGPGMKDLTKGRFTLLRPNLSDVERTEFINRLRGLVPAAEAYGAAHGPEARKTLLGRKETVLAAINELLVPKSDSKKSVTRAQVAQHHAMDAFKACPTNNPYSATCSGGLAAALPKGRHVVPGKAPERVVPSDFLRSKLFTPIGRYDNKPLTGYERMLKHGPTLSRLLIGGTAAGGVYGLSKLLDKKKPAVEEDTVRTAAAVLPSTPETKEEESPWKQRALQYGLPALAGLGTYALARRQRFSEDPAIAAIQRKSKGRLTLIDDRPGKPTLWDEVKMKLFRGADDVKLVRESDLARERKRLTAAVLSGKKLPTPEKVKRIHGAMLNQGHAAHTLRYKADADPTGNVRNIVRIGDDKLYEGKLWNKYAPKSLPKTYGSVQDVAANVLKGPPGSRANRLQTHLRSKYPKGFILKPRNDSQLGDNLLTHADDFATILKDKSTGKHPYLKKMLAKPDDFIVQEALPLAKEIKMPGYARITGRDIPIEYRVHVVNGRVVPELSTKRWLGLNPYTSGKTMRRMNRDTQAHVDRMDPKYLKNTMMGMDVAQLADGSHRIIETNPGGQSGYLMPDYSKIPTLSGHKLYKTITGRDSPVIAGAKGLAAAGGTALLASHFKNRSEEDGEEVPPLPRP